MKIIELSRKTAALCLVGILVGVFNLDAQDNGDSGVTAGQQLSVSAQAGETTNRVVTAATDKAKSKVHALPKGIEEIVAMSEAGVSSEILIQFIKNSGILYRPTGADIIVMKQRGLPDEVIMAMLAREKEIEAQVEAARQQVAAPAIVRSLATDGRIDPESYEFFWYHYAYPRALSSSYRTLARYTGPYFPPPFYAGPRWRTDGFSSDALAPRGGNISKESGLPLTERRARSP